MKQFMAEAWLKSSEEPMTKAVACLKGELVGGMDLGC